MTLPAMVSSTSTATSSSSSSPARGGKQDAALPSLEGGLESLNLASTSSPSLPPQNGNGIGNSDNGETLDETLIDALRSSRDRLFILRQEQDINDFVADTSRSEMLLPLMNSYQRLLVHRCADHFRLAHHIDLETKAVKLVRVPETRLPRRRMIQVFNSINNTLRPADISPFALLSTRPDTAASSSRASPLAAKATAATPTVKEAPAATAPAATPAPPAGFRIMRRDPSLGSSSALAANAADSPSSSNSSAVGKKSRKDMTIEEREVAYREARERIFGAASENAETSAAGPANNKAQTPSSVTAASVSKPDVDPLDDPRSAVRPVGYEPYTTPGAPQQWATAPPGMSLEQQQQQQAAWYHWWFQQQQLQQQQQLAAAQPYAYLSQQAMWPAVAPPPPFGYPPQLMPPPFYPWQYTTTAPSPTTAGPSYPTSASVSGSSALSAYNLDAFSPFPPTPSNLSSSGTGSVGLPSPAPSVVSSTSASASSRDGEGTRRATAWQRQQQQQHNGAYAGAGDGASLNVGAADYPMAHRGVPPPPPSAFMPPFAGAAPYDPLARSASSSPISSLSARSESGRGVAGSNGANGSARRNLASSSSGRLNVGERTLFDPRAGAASSSSSPAMSGSIGLAPHESGTVRASGRLRDVHATATAPTMRLGAMVPAGSASAAGASATASSSQPKPAPIMAGLPPRPDWVMPPSQQAIATQRASTSIAAPQRADVGEASSSSPLATPFDHQQQQSVCGVSTPRSTYSSAARPTTPSSFAAAVADMTQNTGATRRLRRHSAGSVNSASTTTNRSEGVGGGKSDIGIADGEDEEEVADADTDDGRSRSSDGSSSLGPSASASNVGGDDDEDYEDGDRTRGEI